VENELSVHYLGKSSTALENELQATVRVGPHAVIEGRSHLGQTYSQDDPFYDSGLYQENRLRLGHEAENFVFSVEGILTSGSRPAQFGEGLTLEDRVLPQAVAPGSYIGVRYEGRF
jgi:hypothetical protein